MHIIGAGGHAKVIVDILDLQGEPIEGVWDDNASSFLESKIAGSISEFEKKKDTVAIIAIGANNVRSLIVEKLNNSYGLAIHPSSVIARSASLAEGCVVMANATINSDVNIGRHSIINTNASIDHDCEIGDFVHLSPKVGLAGNVTVGEGANIGIGACVIQGIKIGKWAIIGAGAVIIRDVPDYAVVVGNPGRIIKYNK